MVQGRRRMGRLDTAVNLFILLVVLVSAASASPISWRVIAKSSSQGAIVRLPSRHLLQMSSGSGAGTSATSDTTDDMYDDTTVSDHQDNAPTSRRPPQKPQTSTTSKTGKDGNEIVPTLVGSLVTLSAIIVIFIVVIIILIIVVVKINRRRKVERDLVTRTKQDIFEGVTSGVTQEEMSSITKYNVDVANLENSVKKSEDRAADSGQGVSKGLENPGRESEGERSKQEESGNADAESSSNDVASSST